jgi:hypothetical protein
LALASLLFFSLPLQLFEAPLLSLLLEAPAVFGGCLDADDGLAKDPIEGAGGSSISTNTCPS